MTGIAVVVVAAAVAISLAVAGGGGGGSGSTAGGSPQLRLAALSTLGTLKPAPAPGRPGPEGIPIPAGAPLATTATGATGQNVDRISCQRSERTPFHIHAHLAVFVHGSARQILAGIGIPGAQAQNTASGPFVVSGTCLYWLHTHAADGIIHIESPVRQTYTLGQFFDEWGQPLGPHQAGPATGHVVALYDGKVYQGNPRTIPLNAHAQFQLEVGTSLIAPQPVTFPSNL